MLTNKEKNIILVIALVLLLGAVGFVVRKVIKKQRPLSSKDVKMQENFDRENENEEIQNFDIPVNINKANLSEIEALPYLGIQRAKDIIEYREKIGPFKSLEELTNISGIGAKTLEKLKPLITL
ncbi:MAG: helix-hairpin-helix domain-containing protein [Candidatus Neomarinimicrobiota bacterium]|jgi:comEA protein